jgi:hypothetical protein
MRIRLPAAMSSYEPYSKVRSHLPKQRLHHEDISYVGRPGNPSLYHGI